MAAPTLTQIREALAENLATLDDIQVSAYMLANPTPPAAHLYPIDIEYDLAMQRGLDKHAFLFQAFVGLTGDIAAQMWLDQLLAPAGPQSVKGAIQVDPTLGGLVDNADAVSATGYRTYVQEGRPPLLGCEWRLETWTSGH